MGKTRHEWQMWFLWGTFLVLAAATQLVWHWENRNWLTGDEPPYLLMTSGIMRYGSFEMTAPNQREKKLHEVIRIEFDGHLVPGKHGLYSAHNVGLPLLLIIPYSAAGLLGVRVLMTLLASTAVFTCWKLASLHTDQPWIKLTAVAPVTLALPLLSAAGQIYPDILAGLICLNALLWIQTFDSSRRFGVVFLLGFSIAFLPWLQIKNAAPATMLAGMICWLAIERRNWRLLTFVVASMLISAGLLCSYNLYAFGALTGPYAGGPSIEYSRTSRMVLFGLLLDQHQGLLIQNPLHFIGLLALAPLFRWNWKLSAALVLTFLALIVPNALHVNWYGGWSFAGRFGWGATIVLMNATVFGLVRLQQASRRSATLFCAAALSLQAYFYLTYTYGNVDLYNRATNTWLEDYSSYFGSLGNWLPAAYNVNWAYQHLPNRTFGFLAIACVLLGAFALRSFSRYTLPLVLFIAALSIFVGSRGESHLDTFNYTGQTLPSLVGHTKGHRRIAAAGVHREGWLTFGPYVPLPNDRFELRVRYRSNTTPQQVVGKWDVQSTKVATTLAEGNLVGTDNSDREIVIPFETRSTQPELYQFRNYWNGTASLEVIAMELKRRS